ncbi:MAG: acyltransferase [Terrimicrobiaceae bacterium]|nr:acyltransferase [Terrimicrobiaceae bacterium]
MATPTVSSPKFLAGHALLRGLLAIVVFLGHGQFEKLWPSKCLLSKCYGELYGWNNQAVDIFFTLSGFILIYIHRPEGSARWQNYFASRIARIYPLYLVATTFALTLFAICSASGFKRVYAFDFPSQHAPLLDVWPPLLIVENFIGIQQWTAIGGVHNSINFPAWSISVELLLYLTLYPLFRWLYRYIRITPALALLLSTLSLGCNVLYQFGIDPISGSSLLLRGITGFAGGAFLYRAICNEQPPDFSRPIFTMGLVAFSCTALNVIPRELLPLAALPLLYQISILKIASEKIESFCRLLGDLSYPVYLIHIPAMKLILFVLALWGMDTIGIFNASSVFKLSYISVTLIIVFGAAFLSHKFLEKPARQYIKARFSNGAAENSR